MTFLLVFLIGFLAGLRALTAPATTAWAVYLGWLKAGGQFSLLGSIPSVAILTLLAIVELVADKLPQTPNRTSPPGLAARLVTGGLTGACIAAAGSQGALLGAVLGPSAVLSAVSLATELAQRWENLSIHRIRTSPSLKI